MGVRLFQPDVETNRIIDAFAVHGMQAPAAGVVFGPRETGPGVPLGGIGTGYASIDLDGSWGQCTFANEFVNPRRPVGSPFRLETSGATYSFSTAGRVGLVPARGLRYFGHYPVADMLVDLGPGARATVRAFSPLIPGDAAASNTPAAGFDIHLLNTGAERLAGRLVFELPSGAPDAPRARSWADMGLTGVQVVATRHEREFGHVLAGARRDGISAQPVEGSDPAVAFPVDLSPGEDRRYRFILAWCHPYLTTSDGHPRVHRYGTRFPDAGSAAAHLARNFDPLLRRVLEWQGAVYRSSFPGWLKDWLINSLYTLPKNTLWLSDDNPDGWYGPEGLFTHSESHTGCPITETIVCRIHGHFPALFFFPELERSTLCAFRHYQLSDGEIPFAFGTPTGLDMPIYRRQHPINSSEYVLLVQRYYARVGDDDFLREFYPSAQAALRFTMTLDCDHDGLVDDHPHNLAGDHFPANQFYDVWPWYGASAYVAGIGLAAWVAGSRLAVAVGDRKFEEECRQRLSRGLGSFRDKLWTGEYYRLYAQPETGRFSDAVLCNQLMGEWCTRVGGLGPLFPAQDTMQAIRTIAKVNVAGTAYGAVNSMRPDGKPDNSGDHATNIFVSEVTAAACTWMYTGVRQPGEEVIRRLHGALVRHRCLWDEHCLLRAQDGGPLWGREYYSNAIAWAVPMAMEGTDVAAFMTSGGLGHAVIEAAALAKRP